MENIINELILKTVILLFSEKELSYKKSLTDKR